MKTIRIAILAYDGCMGTEVFGIADVLMMAVHVARSFRNIQQSPFDLQVIGLGGRTVSMAGGIPLGVKRPVGKFDLLIVPGPEISRRGEWGAKLENLSPEISYIQKKFAQGTSVASVCIGAFLLGEAGLIAGRKVTTSWLFAPDLASRFPTAKLSPAEILIEDGAVITTGAVSSAFDLAINIVKRHLGAQVATATARIALLPNQRVSQAPYVDSALMGQRMPSFSCGVMQWLQDRLAETYDLERLALAFHVSTRTLLRRIKAETGQSPLTLLQNARVEKAKQLLEETTWSTARITEEVGYTDVPTFTRLFAELVGETPAKYRRR